MNIACKLEDFKINMVYFMNPIKNTVIDNSSFIRILYSNNLFVLNGLYLVLNLDDIYFDNNNKNKICFNPENNIYTINFIKNMEYNLIKKVNIKNKNISTKIYDQLNTGFIKITNDIQHFFSSKFILKISGFWESTSEIGLTYKFIDVENEIGINNNLSIS